MEKHLIDFLVASQELKACIWPYYDRQTSVAIELDSFMTRCDWGLAVESEIAINLKVRISQCGKGISDPLITSQNGRKETCIVITQVWKIKAKFWSENP